MGGGGVKNSKFEYNNSDQLAVLIVENSLNRPESISLQFYVITK